MRIPALLALLALAACASKRPGPAPENGGKAYEIDLDEIVAYLDGEPLTWGEIAKRMMELNPEDAVNKYVLWRVTHDLKRRHGVRNTPEDLHRRALVAVEQVRKMDGEEGFKARLERMSMNEEQFVGYLEKRRNLNDTLALEKLVVYDFFRSGAVNLDWVIFTEEEDARTFVEYIGIEKDFDKAFERLLLTRMKGQHRRVRSGLFSPGLCPPEIDPWIRDAVFELKKGESTAVEHSQTGRYYVLKVSDRIAGREVALADIREEVFEQVLKDPPGDQLLRALVGLHFRKAKIEIHENWDSKGN